MGTDRRRHTTDITDQLTPHAAGRLLDRSERHVRRLIARGELEGTASPYRTTRAAVDAYRFAQRARAAEQQAADVRPMSGAPDRADGLVAGVMSEIAAAREQIERLARDVGRLEAELAVLRPLSQSLGGNEGRGGDSLGAKVERLARENGRLEAERAQLQRREQARGDSRGQAQIGRAGPWGRVGRWLRG